jgi:CubicO group peptidase (beta-lactamase class C family)
MQAWDIPGAALAVTRNGKLILARGYTWSEDWSFSVDPTSLFRIASTSKPITAIAMLRLVEDGLLDLSDKLTSILRFTPLPGQVPDPRLDDVTVLHLLQHHGGWDRDIAFDPMFHDYEIAQATGAPLPITQADIMTFMAGQELQHTPGTQYAYSNYGYLLAGRIIEAISGQQYDSYVQQEVLAPLNITRMRLGQSLPELRAPDEVTYYSTDKHETVFSDTRELVPWPYGGFNLENMDSHGGWLASAVDLARFASAFDDPPACPILNERSIETMFAAPETGLQDDGWYYGCGWLVRPLEDTTRNIWHDGSLPGSYALMVRRWDGLNWVILFNRCDEPRNRWYNLDVDRMLHRGAEAVTRWPDHDFFDEYL